MEVDGRWEVWGSVSYGRTYCHVAWFEPTLDKGSVFAMVWGAREWIEGVTGGSCPPPESTPWQ